MEMRKMERKAGFLWILGTLFIWFTTYTVTVVILGAMGVGFKEAADMALSLSCTFGILAYVGIGLWGIRHL